MDIAAVADTFAVAVERQKFVFADYIFGEVAITSWKMMSSRMM